MSVSYLGLGPVTQWRMTSGQSRNTQSRRGTLDEAHVGCARSRRTPFFAAAVPQKQYMDAKTAQESHRSYISLTRLHVPNLEQHNVMDGQVTVWR